MTRIIQVTDIADPRVAPYTAIRERDLTQGHGARFIIEGKVTLETALRRGRFAIESLFLAQSRLAPLAGVLEQVPGDVPIYVGGQAVMDAVAGFPVHRGILACGLKGAPLGLQDVTCAGDGPLLMLAGLSNHDNVGACFRNAAAFGARGVLLDGQSCDPLYRKAIRVSSGTCLWLPFAHGGDALENVRAVKEQGFEVWSMTPRPDAEAIGSFPIPEKVAVLLGAEGPGLPAAVIKAARPVRIAMSPGFDSINVATAGAIALSAIYTAQR